MAAGPEQMMQIAAQAAQAAADAAASMKEFIAKDLANKQRFGEAGKVVKMPESFGSEDHEADQRCWRDFLLNFKSWLYYADSSFEVGLTNVEKNPKTPTKLSDMEPTAQSKSIQLYSILTGILKGKPLRLLRQQSDRNGLEVYRELIQLYTPSSKTRSLALLQAYIQAPSFTRDRTMTEQILNLERMRSEYCRCSGQDVTDDLALSILVRCLPQQVRQHIQLQMTDAHSYQDVKSYVLSYEMTTASWSTAKVHSELGVVPSPPVAGGPAPMEVDALTSKGGKKGKSKSGKFDSKGKNKGGKKGKSFSKGKGNNQSNGGKGQSSWQNSGNWQDRSGSWQSQSDKGKGGSGQKGKGSDFSGKGKGSWNQNWNSGKGNWNYNKVNQMTNADDGGTSQNGGAASSSTSVPSSATTNNVSSGSSGSSGNVRSITRVSTPGPFIEDLSSDAAYKSVRFCKSTSYGMNVLQCVSDSYEVYNMCLTDDDGHWDFPSYESDLTRAEPSHLRAISNAPMPGDTIEVLLDSGADGSALPLSYGSHGVSVETAQPLHFVDAQGGSLGIQDVRLAEICFGDVSIRDHFIIAPVTGPIISLGHLMKLGWIFERFNGDLFLVKGDHSIPVEFRKNSIVAHGTISMLTSVSTDDSVNASPQPCQVSTIRLTTLANLADGWNKFNNNLYAIKTYAPQYVNTTLCPGNELMWLRTTLALYPTGYEILEYAQAISSLEDFELPIPNREQVQEVITLAHNYALPYSYLGFEMTDDHDDEEFLSMNPPPPVEISAPMEVEASSAAHPPAADGEAEPVPDDRVVPLEDVDEGSVVVDGATITLDTPLRVIRIACESLGLSKKGSKKVCFSRICTFIKNQQIVAAHAAESTVVSEQTRVPKFQKAPVTPTPDQVAAHNLTHEPFADWCELCVAHRSRQDRHVPSTRTSSAHSIISFDFGFSSRLEGERRLVFLCIHDRDTGLIAAVPSMGKGGKYFAYWTTELTRFVISTQHKEIGLRCDGEPSTKSLMEACGKSCKALGIKVHYEPSPVGDHQANGAAEKVVDLVRTHAGILISQVEKQCGSDRLIFGSMHPLYGWALAHAAWLHNRFKPNDGRTAYEIAHDRVYTGKLVMFGEQVLGYLRTSQKGRPRWLKGTWLGKTNANDAHIVAFQGTLFVTRSVRRLTNPFNLEALGEIEVGPWDHGLASLGHRLIINKKQSVPVGIAISGPIPEKKDDDEVPPPDEAGSDPDTEVLGVEDEQSVAVPSDAVISQSGASHPVIPPQAGQGGSTSSGSGDTSMSTSVAAERHSLADALPSDRPTKQARMNALSVSLGDIYDEKHEDELTTFDFHREDLETLEDYDDSLEYYDYDDEEVVETADGDKLKMLMFPFSSQEPKLSEDELQLLDSIADEVEMDRLRKMDVLKPPESVESGAKKLSTRFVRTWRDKYIANQHVWLRGSRFVAREYAWADQRSDLFSPASSSIAARLLPTIFMRNRSSNFILGAIDVADAFLTVDQKEATLVTACDSMGNKTEYSLGKVLPGQRAGSQLWYESFSSMLKQKLGMQECESYPSLLKDPSSSCFLLLHVDDMMVVGDASYIDSKFLPALKASYKVSCSFTRNVGDEVVFLKRTHKLVTHDRLTINAHPKHIDQLVKLAGIKPSNVCKKTPGHPLIDEFDTTKELNATESSEFRSCVGILLYLAPDYPNAQHTIRHLSTGMSKPTQRMKDILRHLVSYLHGTRELCLSLQFKGDSSGVHHSYGGSALSSTCRSLSSICEEAYMEIFSDADWASNKQNRRSISATCIFFGTCLLHSASRTQKLISLSSGESEMYAASSAACDALLLKTLLCFCIGKNLICIHYLDSSAARGILQRQGVGRVRHMSCRVLWMQDLMKENNHKVTPVPGVHNVSDIGTKRLSKPRLDELMGYCNMGYLNGDTFIPLKQTMNVGARNLKALRKAFHTIPEWQFQVLMLSALSSSATGAPTEEMQREPNTTMLALAMGLMTLLAIFAGWFVFLRKKRGCMACKFVQATVVMTDVSTDPVLDDECVDSIVSESPEAKKRRYQRDPMSECSDPDYWISQNHHCGSSDEVSMHGSQLPVDSPLNLENRLLNLIDNMLFNLKSPELRVTRAWTAATLHMFHALYVMYSALMNHDFGAMEDVLELCEDEDPMRNVHAKERIIDCFITDFGAGIPMFVNFRDALSKFLEFLHRRLQQPHVLKRIAFTMMETFSAYRNCIRLDQPEDSSGTSSDSNEAVQASAQGPMDEVPRVGPMFDPPLAEDPKHGFDRNLQEMIDARERALTVLWQRRNDALVSGTQEELWEIDAEIDLITSI